MNGIQIEYLLGIYFLVVSLIFVRESEGKARIITDPIKLIAGILLTALAFFGKALI